MTMLYIKGDFVYRTNWLKDEKLFKKYDKCEEFIEKINNCKNVNKESPVHWDEKGVLYGENFIKTGSRGESLMLYQMIIRYRL
jgi:hypothetical protein